MHRVSTSIQVCFNLVDGHKALLGQQNWLTRKNQLTSMGKAIERHTERSLHLVGMHFVVGAVNVAGGLQERRV